MLDEARIGSWLQTAMGRAYWPRDPRPEEVFLDDIAISLSNQCRFGGHVKIGCWYPVSQHVLLVSEVVEREVKRDPSISPYTWQVTTALAFMHDWAEAYLVDVPRPVKKYLVGYDAIEEHNFNAIRLHFDMPLGPLPQCVWNADERLLFTERRDLLMPPPRPWEGEGGVDPLPQHIVPLSPEDARRAFFSRAEELGIR